jgi:hypothetical protein
MSILGDPNSGTRLCPSNVAAAAMVAMRHDLLEADEVA